MKKIMKIVLLSVAAFALVFVAPIVFPNKENTATVESATAVKISKTTATMYVGGKALTLQITGTKSTVTWTSSDRSVATVSNKGMVAAKKIGKTTITASVDGKKYECKVTVLAALPTTVKLDPSDASTFNNGKFQGWGTSFAWWANRIGYSDVMSEKAASLFYDSKNGLGLNIIRYNIGGGDNPLHNHITRTDSEVPGYLYWNDTTKKYEYDWDADYNQRNALLKAIAVSDEDLIIEAFSNSPPYFMTNSGCSSGAEVGLDNNLREDSFDDFSEYLATVVLHYKNDLGISFQSISAMNESTSGWDAYSPKQEGCHYDSGETQSNMLVELSKALSAKGLADVIISGTDETNVDTQRSSYSALSEKAKEVVGRIDTHTYTATDMARTKLNDLAEENKVNLWMSEVDGGSTIGTNSGEMGAGLWLGQQIISDMNGLKPSAWIMWQAIGNFFSTEGYNGNKDAAQMVDKNKGFWGVAVADIDNNDILLTQKYYAFGQFTRYIRPGYTIISTNNSKSLAAYDKKSKTLVVVAINTKAAAEKYNFDLSMFKSFGSKVQVVRTSGTLEDGENWAELKAFSTTKSGFSTEVKGFSITTFILKDVVYK